MNDYTKQMLEDYRVLTQHVIETTNDDNLKMLAENTLELHEGFDFGEMGKADVGLNEAIEKINNVMNVVELYQAVINFESVADIKTDPKYHVHVVGELFELMFKMNQTLLDDLEKVTSTLYELHDDEE